MQRFSNFFHQTDMQKINDAKRKLLHNYNK